MSAKITRDDLCSVVVKEFAKAAFSLVKIIEPTAHLTTARDTATSFKRDIGRNHIIQSQTSGINSIIRS